jgi:hypothetical protein
MINARPVLPFAVIAPVIVDAETGTGVFSGVVVPSGSIMIFYGGTVESRAVTGGSTGSTGSTTK